MADAERQRLDRWLFFARVVKSRSLATRLVQSGRVRLNREKAAQPSHPVRPGDVLTITLDRTVLVYRVVAAGTRRGPAPEARLLYEDLTPPPPPRHDAPPTAPAALREPGAGRPTKKDRRAIDRFEEGERFPEGE